MSDLGPSPTVVGQPVSSGTATGAREVSTRLPLPATVRLDSVVWLYIIPIAAIHLAALTTFIPGSFRWTGLALAVLGVPFYGLGITLG